VDAIQIIAVLEKPTGPELLLEKQFRPPTGKIVIEFPAGMVDEGETPEQSAVRELREETGFIGEVITDRGGSRPVHWNGEFLGGWCCCTELTTFDRSCFFKVNLALQSLMVILSYHRYSSCTLMIHMKIDLTKEVNQNPKPELEEGEIIECFSVPLRDLFTECRRLEAQGFGIDGKVGAFAEGLELASIWQAR
jgi:ADP-ribose pyrophosphatase